MNNTFGRRFGFSTFGESHGEAIGCIIDGVPSGVRIDEGFIKKELERRAPGRNSYQTKRKEPDVPEILSGVFEGYSTGAPIGILIRNTNKISNDYSNIKDLFRPGHADISYFLKYGTRDYRGGGRSSARETACRVAAGAIAKLLLKELSVEIQSGVYAVGGIDAKNIDFNYAKKSDIYALDRSVEEAQKNSITLAKTLHNSIGGAVLVRIKNPPYGLGEPLYYKLDAILADAMMGINGVKAVEIGLGAESSRITGSENNDFLGKDGFLSNNAGGILGGISTGEDIDIKVYFKPTPSIFKEQKTLDREGSEQTFELKGRHDPCIALRGSIVAEAMASIVIADMLLLNLGSKIDHLKSIYKTKNIKEYFAQEIE